MLTEPGGAPTAEDPAQHRLDHDLCVPASTRLATRCAPPPYCDPYRALYCSPPPPPLPIKTVPSLPRRQERRGGLEQHLARGTACLEDRFGRFFIAGTSIP